MVDAKSLLPQFQSLCRFSEFVGRQSNLWFLRIEASYRAVHRMMKH